MDRACAQSANLEVAARRIVMAKNTNAGQICVAPDYILVHHKVCAVVDMGTCSFLPNFEEARHAL